MLPRSNSGGKILLTTRTTQVAQSLATAYNERHPCIAIYTPGNNDAVRMFLSAARIEREGLDAKELQKARDVMKAIRCLPLAVDQATSFAKESRLRIGGTLDVYKSEQIKEVY